MANLGADPDHDWHPAPPAETAAATALNNQFNALQLVRPPDLGMGDFVALNGSGHHFDHQTLVVGGATNDFVDNNVKVTLAGTYEPFIIIDASGIANQQQQQQEITNLDNLFATRLTQAERARIIWYPVGPGNAATVLPAAATQAWAGPPSVEPATPTSSTEARQPGPSQIRHLADAHGSGGRHCGGRGRLLALACLEAILIKWRDG